MENHHGWNVTPTQAVAIQRELKDKTILYDDFGVVERVAGVDVGIDRASKRGRAAVAVLRLSDLKVVDMARAEMELSFPYVPGLLSFREIPVIVQALDTLSEPPDILLCDGQGTAHPRRLGIACHLGIVTNIPTIGVAKTKLVGKHGRVPARRGQWTELIDKDECIGAVLRTREKVKPLYISPGHRISLGSSISYVMKCVTRYRLPETTRQAHNLSLFQKKT